MPGAYAQMSVAPADRLVKLPDGLTFKDGAAAMLQGMTAHYLITSTYPLKKGDVCLVQAAAGGMGLLLCQMAKMRGATVIGTVSTEEKAALAKDAGADHVILYTKQDFEPEVKRITDGVGVHVVYDGVGQTTFDKGINCLRPRGLMALFGAASGPVPPLDLQILNARGSLFVTRPSLNHHIAARERAARAGGRRARMGPRRQGEAAGGAPVPARRGRRGAPRPRRAQDHGKDPADPRLTGSEGVARLDRPPPTLTVRRGPHIMLKWLLIGVGLLAGLAVAAIVALPWLLDTPAVQAQVAQAVSHALGRPVRFASLSVSALPVPTVRLKDLRVAEDPAFGTDPFVTVGEGRVRVRLWPLLSGRVELADLTLMGPRIALVKDAAGRLNIASLGVPAHSPRRRRSERRRPVLLAHLRRRRRSCRACASSTGRCSIRCSASHARCSRCGRSMSP